MSCEAEAEARRVFLAGELSTGVAIGDLFKRWPKENDRS
jgi:hypothetical protein